MAKGQRGSDAAKVLKDLLILQLGQAGVPQQTIRSIVGCDLNRVTEIVRHLKPKASAKKKKRRSGK